MAASMVLLSRTQRPFIKHVKSFYLQVRSGYFVLLPEIPKDTPETNQVLQVGSIPRLNSITPENCYNGVGKLLIQFDSGLSKIEKTLEDNPEKKDFDTILKPLEFLLAQLDYGWSTTRALFAIRHDDNIAGVYQKLHPRVLRGRAQRFGSKPIYQTLQELNGAHRDKLTDVQRRVIDKYLLEAHLNAIELSKNEKTHLETLLNKIAKEKDGFRTKLGMATDRFKHIILDYSVVSGFPEPLLQRMAEDRTNPSRGPWYVTLQPYVYENFMKYCGDRDLRWNAWRAYNSRASTISDATLNNSIHMEEIRSQRATQAKLLGYSSYSELSMETKMAGSLENVQAMITSLRVNTRPKMLTELEELQEFAASRGFDSSLELWDVPYWRRKQLMDICGFEQEDLRSHFQLVHVLKALFDLSKQLFGVTVKDATAEVGVWNSGVTFHKLFDEHDNHVGSFFLDPYFRPGKLMAPAFLESGISRCDTIGTKPLAFLVFNFQPPVHELPSLLTISDVTALFQKFGLTLQHLLTTSPYLEVAGLTNIPWDAVDVCAHFMACWLDDVDTFQSLTNNYHTGQQLKRDDCAKVIKAQRHMAAYDLQHVLYRSALDLELYTKKDYWLDVTRKVWAEYMPFPLNKSDVHPCSFSEIFVEEHQASYYSLVWSKMIAADLFSAFLEVGLDNKEEVQRLGRRFRDTILLPGGSCSPNEAFRRFRGRDPCPNALLTVNKIT